MKKSDILWYNSATGEAQVWYMDGHKLVDRGTVLGSDGNAALVGPPFRIVGAGDMNGDGRADIVWYNSSTGETQIWYMDGHSLAGRGTVLGLDGKPAFIGPPFSIVGLGDMDGDGKADIVWYNSATGETQIWYMDGHKLVGRGTVLGLDGTPAFIGPPFRIVGVGDMDGNRQADIVWYNSLTGETQVWYMDGHRLVGRGTVLGLDGKPVFIGPPFSIVGIGDMDGGGKADIIWHHSATGETQVWYMDGHRLVDRGTVLGADGKPALVGPPFGIVGIGEFSSDHPPGRHLRKVISLDLLQRKFDEFLNKRGRPPFLIRLNGTHYGASTVTVTFDDPAKGYDHDPFVNVDLAKPGEALEFPGIIFGTHRFYFRDVNSDGLTLNLVNRSPVTLEAVLHFETGGPVELDAEDFPDIDFTHFSISMKFQIELDIVNHKLSLITFPEWINPDISVDVTALPDGTVAGKIESNIKGKIYAGLKDHLGSISGMVTTWLIGGDFYVLTAGSDGQSLTVDYIIPPGQLEPFPEDPQNPLDPGLLANIDHIVVLMMENRSFDHMLGYLSKEGGRGDIDGLHGGEKNRYKGADFPSFPLPDTRFDESPGHGHGEVENEVDGGKMDGFVTSFAAKFPDVADPGRIMGYHTAAHVPVYDALAREFLVCQRWFAAHPGPTFCNRFYTLTGRLNRNQHGDWQFDNPPTAELVPIATRTLFDHLTEHGVSWRYYERGYCFLRMFAAYTTDTTNILDAGVDSANFAAAARTGDLPSVTFIDPDFIDFPPGYDDGAPADIARGQHFIGTILSALIQGPLWSKTLFVITYDEHGGFYDHVPPPAAVPVSAIDHYGVRVPAIIVSPWVDKGAVSSVVFDHTSIAKTIARRFMSAHPPDMGARVAAANDLSQVLRRSARQDRPAIPIPADPTPDLAMRRLAAAQLESDDFKGLLNAMRSRHPVHRQ